MDTNGLIIWLIGAVMISIGLPLFYVGRYFSATEDEKKRKARDLKIIGIIWMSVGLIIYLVVLITRIIF
jgi:uncharacterized membrane-anchored protein